MIVDQNAVREFPDVIGIVIVAGQRHRAAEGGGVHWSIVASEVRLEITYAAVAVEDGAQRLTLVPLCILENILELIYDVVVGHHIGRRSSENVSDTHAVGQVGKLSQYSFDFKVS